VQKIAVKLQRIILTFWIGGIWATGYLVVPSLFRQLPDPALAGQLAGQLFTLMSWAGLLCAALLLVVFYLLDAATWRYLVILVIVGIISLNLFYISPEIASLKATAAAAIVKGSELYNQFAVLHGLASGLYLLVSLLGLLLVISQAGEKKK
jgi:hypothetical protein